MGVHRAMHTGIPLLAAVVVWALAPGASAASRAPACSAKGATVVARSGTSLLLTAPVGRDDEYGPGTRVMTCRKGHRRVGLVSTGPGDALTLAHPSFTPAYVAFAATLSSVACSKYLGNDPQCTSQRVTSYNRRTGRLRASGSGPADALVVTPAGWVAWLSPADLAGARTLQAVDSAGTRVLASGAIDPASLQVAGATVSWTVAGVTGSTSLS